MFRCFLYAVILTQWAILLDHASTRHHATAWKNKEGVIEDYEHQDEETKYILGLLSGKEELTNEWKRKFLLDFLERELSNHPDIDKMRRGKLFSDMTIDELEFLAKEINNDVKESTEFEPLGPEQKIREAYYLPGRKKDEYTPLLYNLLCQLQQKSGNPKLRLMLGANRRLYGWYEQFTSFYDPISNTIYILTGNDIRTLHELLNEYGHPQQHDRNPDYAMARFGTDLVKTLWRMAYASSKDFEKMYRKRYKEKHTYEHQAHTELKEDTDNMLRETVPEIAAAEREVSAWKERMRALHTAEVGLIYSDRWKTERQKIRDMHWLDAHGLKQRRR